MAETIQKFRPDRDLQCFFERPSAIASMQEATANSFKVSGTWRQQFDWAIVEWNRDNTYEHPLFRKLPDGDLRGMQLVYDERRINAIPLDSDLYPTIDWPYLRIWAEDNGSEQFYQVALKPLAVPIEGAYVAAKLELELSGVATANDYVGISFLGENHTYQVTAVDTIESVVQALVDSVNTFSTLVAAERIGRTIRLYHVGEGGSIGDCRSGANGNRVGVYGFTSAGATEVWNPAWGKFSGGQSPTQWRVTIPFDSLTAKDGRSVPVHNVRKIRWTYAAELQERYFERSEFEVQVTNWTVSGANLLCRVAGPGSYRIEDDAADFQRSANWSSARGNFSGGTISYARDAGAWISCQYPAAGQHELYLGTRMAPGCGTARVFVDGVLAASFNLLLNGEDVLVRRKVGTFSGGLHSVRVEHAGPQDSAVYLDFLEVCFPHTELPQIAADSAVAVATDWDTDHSLALAAERTAWMIHSLGLRGRVNHYVGALVFYELARLGHVYASTTVEFVGQPLFSSVTTLRIGHLDYPPESATEIQHLNRIGDTAETIAKAFELELNRGYTSVWAEASGNVLTIHARVMGAAGNRITISASPESGGFACVVASPTLSGGVDGQWITDTAARPCLNRAARDWSRAFYRALHERQLDVVAAYSTELQHADTRPEAGLAQRYPNGEPVLLNTPAVQTCFSPESLTYWRDVHKETAALLVEAGCRPYLQFGEVQWWYFPREGVGMPFYDAYTTSSFELAYGRPMRTILSNDADPAYYAEEAEHLQALLGTFTSQIMSYVRGFYPDCRFEVLYPTDVNAYAFNQVVNFPGAHWQPGTLDCLKTESFTYTLERNLNLAGETIRFGAKKGFARGQRSFLVGIGDSSTAWAKEVLAARAEAMESIVLFALDQLCLVGYPVPLGRGSRRSLQQGQGN